MSQQEHNHDAAGEELLERFLALEGSSADVLARWEADGHGSDPALTSTLRELLELRASLAGHGDEVAATLAEAGSLPRGEAPGEDRVAAFFAERLEPRRSGWVVPLRALSALSAAAAVLFFTFAWLGGRGSDELGGGGVGPRLGSEGLAAWEALDARAMLLEPVGVTSSLARFRWAKPAPAGLSYELVVADENGAVLVRAQGLEGTSWEAPAEVQRRLPARVRWELVLTDTAASRLSWSETAWRE